MLPGDAGTGRSDAVALTRRCRAAQPRRRRRPARRAVGRHQSRPPTSRPSSGAGSMYALAASRSPKYSSPPSPTDGRRRHRRPGRQRRCRRAAVRRPQPVGVVDDDVARAGDGAAERHRARRPRPARPCPAGTAYSSPGCRGTTGTAARGTGRRPARRPAGAGSSAADGGGERDGDEQRHGVTRPDGSEHRTWSTLRRRATFDGDEPAPRSAGGQATPAAASRDRRWSTDLVWICDTRLSVTPSTRPISASVRPSS